MRLAVDQRDAYVDHRVAGQHALRQLVADALLHRRDELPGHRPADHPLGELDPGAALQRLDLHLAHRVLPVPAGLLDQPALHRGRAQERLPQRGAHRLDLDADAPALPQRGRAACRRGPGPSSTAPPGGSRRSAPAASSRPRRPAAAAPTTSFSSSLREAACTATGSSGSGSSHGSTRAGRLLPDSVSEVSAAVSLETRTRSPAIACGFGPGLLAERGGQRSGRARRRCRGRGDRRPGGRRSAAGGRTRAAACPARSVPENTRTRDSRPTNGSLVVRTTSATSGPSGSQRQRAEVLALRGLHRRQRRGVRRREAVLEQVVQLLDAHPGRRVGGHDREEPGGGDRGAEVGRPRVSNSMSSPLRCRSSRSSSSDSVDDRLHQRTAPLLDQRRLLGVGLADGGRAVAVVGHRAPQQVDQAGQAAAGQQRDVGRLGVAERPLAAGHRLVEVGPGLLELGHRDGPRHPDHRTLPPQQPGRLVDLVAGRHHEQGRVAGPQAGPHLADEVRDGRGCRAG